MAASSMPSLRSSRRVAGVLPATDRTATEKSKRNDHERTKSRTLTQGVDRSTPADPAFEMPPKKRPRVAAPSHGQRSTRQELTPTKAGTVRHAPKGQGHTNVVTTSESRPLKAESHALPNMRPPREEKRQLRSQGGASRIKSDLALFFPCYDEMISNERRQPEFWSTEMSFFVIEEESARPGPTKVPSKARPSTPKSSTARLHKTPTSHINGVETSPMQRGSPLASPGVAYPKLFNTQRLDFSSVEKGAAQVQSDPLDDEVYTKAHRRAERREKQLRNIEKNKAQHEKNHLEQLLEGLRGPDWLKVMGISGITDSEKKEYERKRDFFIGEVGALLEKFRAWKEEERRRKLAKDQAAAASEIAAEEEEADPQSLEADIDDGLSDGDPPDYSDVDAWAARQLHQEAFSATGGIPIQWPSTDVPTLPTTETIDEPSKPFTSFYLKPYLRAAAIGKHRRSGRSTTAFGRPLPEVRECDFSLPPDILTEEAKIASARSRRRLKRESKDAKGLALD